MGQLALFVWVAHQFRERALVRHAPGKVGELLVKDGERVRTRIGHLPHPGHFLLNQGWMAEDLGHLAHTTASSAATRIVCAWQPNPRVRRPWRQR